MLANDEAAVFNISDLWIASATRDEGDSYALEEDVFTEDEDEDIQEASVDTATERDPFLEGIVDMAGKPRQDSIITGTTETRRSPSRATAVPSRLRSGSLASSLVVRPALYQNTGLSRSPLMSPAISRDGLAPTYFDPLPPAATQAPVLAAIPEGKLARQRDLLTVPGLTPTEPNAGDGNVKADQEEKHPMQTFSIWRDLPIGLIAQYTVGALIVFESCVY